MLRRGGSLESALDKEKKHFPPIFLAMARVGERTGMLPEVFSELERYFLREQQLRRSFIARITWPVIQFVLAVLVLAFLIYFFGGKYFVRGLTQGAIK